MDEATHPHTRPRGLWRRHETATLREMLQRRAQLVKPVEVTPTLQSGDAPSDDRLGSHESSTC